MKTQLKSNWMLKMTKIQDSSSEDEKTEKNTQKEVLYPNLYMIPNEKYPHLQRQYLITKLDFLIQVHKKEENIILQKKIGWNILYSFFFQKLFLISKSEREKNKFLNLKEVEFRIRKQIGKIRQKQLTYEEENIKEINFDLFEKKNYNPPISSLFSHNFLNDNSNNILGKSEENSQLVQILNTFLNYEQKDIRIPNIRNVNSVLQKKEESEIKKIKLDKLRRKSNIELKRFDILDNKNSNRLFNDVNFRLEKIIDDENNKNEEKIILREDVIPKGAKKIVEKFVKLHPNNNQIFVEDELDCFQNDKKIYDLEIQNTKMFENNIMDSKRYLFDFQFLKNMLNHDGKKGSSFNFKKEMDNIFKNIDFAIQNINLNFGNKKGDNNLKLK